MVTQLRNHRVGMGDEALETKKFSLCQRHMITTCESQESFKADS